MVEAEQVASVDQSSGHGAILLSYDLAADAKRIAGGLRVGSFTDALAHFTAPWFRTAVAASASAGDFGWRLRRQHIDPASADAHSAASVL
jgi:hypothetical protein